MAEIHNNAFITLSDEGDVAALSVLHSSLDQTVFRNWVALLRTPDNDLPLLVNRIRFPENKELLAKRRKG